MADRVDGRTARREASQARIAAAAAELFAERGYDRTTLDDIAELAGVSKGTIFYSYRGKAELFEQLFWYAVNGITDDIEDASKGLYGWDALVAVAGRLLREIDAEPALAQILVHELHVQRRPWSAQVRTARDRIVAPLARIIGQVAEQRDKAGLTNDSAGLLTPNLDTVAMALLGAVVMLSLDRRAFGGERSIEDAHQVLIASLLGLRPPGPGE